MEGKIKYSLNEVEFKFIRNSYPLHEKLYAYFQTPNGSQPEIGDWIGLYKVGWSTLKEHKIRKQIQHEMLEQCRRSLNVDYVHVVFEQHELPKDIEGLFQFVYITKGDIVKGMSRPFKFERVVSQPEMRRFVDVIGKQEQEQQVGQKSLEQRESFLGRLENDLVKEAQRLNLSWGKVTDEAVNGKLMQKYLNNLRSVQDKDEVSKKVEELVFENGKLCMSLKSRIQEVCELKKECDEMKSINGELLNKLSSAERKVEQLEREREMNVRRIDELTRDLPRGIEQLQGKHLLQDLEETAKWLLQDDCEKIQPELKRTCSLYELDTPVIDARIKLVQRVVEEPTQKRGQLIEKILREVDSTPGQVRLLKRVIEDLKNDNELLRERVRQVEQNEVRPETINGKSITIVPRINLVELAEQRQQQQQQQQELVDRLPSITVQTLTVPEMSTKSVTITGKVEQPKEWQQQQHWQQQQQLRGQVGEYLNRLDEQIRYKIADRLRNKLHEQLQGRIQVEEEQKQQQQPTTFRPTYKIDEMIKQKIEQQQQPRQWSLQTEEHEQQQPKHWRHQQQVEQLRKLRDELVESTTSTTPSMVQTTLSTMCPVCGIAMPGELNVCDFEIHVNSHFTD